MDNYDVFNAGACYLGNTLAQLRTAVAEGRGNEKMIGEITRRERVAAGDVSAMTAGERLHRAR